MMDPSTPKPAESAASSPTGASTADPPLATGFKVGIASISDVVFGLALSIGSLILVSKTPQNGYELVQGIYYFGLSFLIVILVWVSFRRIVVDLPDETSATLLVNVVLLFCVAIEPFLFYVLVTTSTVGNDASTAFAIDIGLMMFLLSILDYLLLRERRSHAVRKLPQEVVDRQGRSIIHHIVMGSIYLVSALPLFWTLTLAGSPVREILWYIALFWVSVAPVCWAAMAKPQPSAEKSGSSVASSRGGQAEAG